MNGSGKKRQQAQSHIEASEGTLKPRRMRNTAPSLSSSQERIWRRWRLDGANLSQTRINVRLTGTLDRRALRAALDRIVARHEILRITFRPEDGGVVASVAPADVGFVLEELAGERRGPLEEAGLEKAPAPLDLERGPLIRGCLTRLGELEHVLAIVQHQIISDTCSIGVLIRELAALYAAFCAGGVDPLPPLDRQFADYAALERQRMTGETLSRRLEYWKRVFADVPEPLQLPARGVRSGKRLFSTERVPVRLPAELHAQLQALAHRQQVSLLVPLLGGWAAILGRWGGRDDILIGTRMPNRPAPDLEALIGPFETLVAFRIRLTDDPTVEQLLRDVKTIVRKAGSHQDVCFEQVLETLSLPAETRPSLQALISVNGVPQALSRRRELTLPGLEISDVSIETPVSPFELSLSLEEHPEGLVGTLEYASDLFERETIERMLAGWETLLGAMVTDIYQTVGRLPVMTQAEKRRVVAEFNETEAPYPKDKLIHELFEEQVEKTPDAVAVEHEGRRLTYSQLNRRANRLARYLLSQGVGPGQVVGICVERGLEMVGGLLAILKAGGAYLPLDPNYPIERLQQMLEDAAPRVVLAETELLGVLPASQAKVIALDGKLGGLGAFVDENVPAPGLGLTSQSLVYVIYTSGSTGRPKGIAMRHQSVVNLIEWHRQVFGPGSGQRVLQFAALSFDVAFQEVFSTLCSGGSLVLLDEWVRRDARALAEFLVNSAIHRLFVPPLMLQRLAEQALGAGSLVGSRSFGSLRDVITAGEQLRVSPEIRDLFRGLEGSRLHNHYGPTETHVVTTLTLEGDPGLWPDLPAIGRPIANTQVYVLDARMQPLPIGASGEIYVGGANVAQGYLNRPDLTEQRFVADSYGADPRSRLYKTGDLGRWREDGTLEYLGRNDGQVKIRGFRIELGEVEAQLTRHGQIKEAAVMAREDEPGQRRLVAYVTARGESAPSIEDLREHMKAALPDYMVPSAFVALEKMPLTPSGKLDRRSLPAPDFSAYVFRDYEPPRGRVEEFLAKIWQELLRVERVGRHDNFFALGGHSYLMVQVMERLRRVGLSTGLQSFFKSTTLAESAAALTRDAPGFEAPPNRIPPGCSAITPDMLPLVELTPEHIERIVQSVPGGGANVQDIYPLAPLQEGILFHHLLDEQKPDTYVLPALLAATRRDRLESLIDALQRVIDRHDVLRTAVHWEGLPRPVQVVYRKATLPVEDIALDPGRNALEQMKEMMRPVSRRLDIGRAPMMRLQVASGSRGGEQYALLQLHHLVCDHESLEALLAEVMAIVDGGEQDLPKAESYRIHVAEALARAGQSESGAFFREKLADVEEPTAPFDLLDIRGDGSRIEQAQEPLPPALAAKVRNQARRFGVTPATLFHAAWALVIACTSGRDDVVFGTVLLGRLQGEAGSRRIIGMFMNTLPLRLRLTGLSVTELIERTQRELVELVSHEQASLAAAQRASGIQASAPLFTALLNYRHSMGAPGQESGGGERLDSPRGVRLLEIREWTNYPIALSVDDWGEGFTLVTQTDESIDPHRMTEYVITALEGLTQALERAPEMRALSLPVLAERQWREVVEAFNATEVTYSREKLIHQLVEEQASRAPDAVAVTQGSNALTYGELNCKANQLARHLQARGMTTDRFAAVCMDRSVEMVVAMLAILKAGGAYVPLDPTYPDDRIAYMLKDAAPCLLLTSAKRRVGLPATDAEIITVDHECSLIAQYAADDLDPYAADLRPTNLAYVIYTSGSTGVPKGVLVEHRGVINLIEWHCRTFDVKPGSRVSSLAAVGFDAAVWEIWPALAAGATVTLAPQGATDDMEELLSWWASEHLDVSFLPTPIAELAFSRGVAPPRLGFLLVGGDRLRHRPQGLSCSLINNYGPTETTVVATSGRLSDADAILHIGKPIANTRIYILDRRRRPVPIGVAGEIYIGGVGVARGYLNQPEMTVERFFPDLFSPAPLARMYRTGDIARWSAEGTIQYLGRNDRQVKIRGFRIELAEIEARLARHPQVEEAVAMAREDEPGELRLVAYVVPRTRTNEPGVPLTDDLRSHLKSALPEYMVPSAFVTLTRLPLTPNGKLDRRALPVPDPGASPSRAYEPLEGPLEEALARIWRDVLKVRQVGRRDNFFDLGGHSLTATQVMARIRTEFSIRIAVGVLFEHPELRDLAAHIDCLCRGRRRDEGVNTVGVPALGG